MPTSSRSIDPESTPQPSGDGHEQQGTLHVGPTGRVHRGPAPRTKAEQEANRAFLAAARSVDFGPGTTGLHAVWMAFAYYASLGPERICRARVDTLQTKAKGSPCKRTVQRHINTLATTTYIKTGKRSGGRSSTHWIVDPYQGSTVSQEHGSRDPCTGENDPPSYPRGVSNRHGQPRHFVTVNHDKMSPDTRDSSTYVPASAPFKGEAQSGSHSSKNSPVTTAAPLKGSPVPSPSPPIYGLASAAEAQPHIDAMRAAIAERAAKAKIPEPDPSAPSTFTLDPDLEARFEEEDRQLHERLANQPARQPAPTASIGCPKCGHHRLMGGSCDQCGHDDGTGFSPNSDYNHSL